jgi:hypothetical protein
MKLKRTSWVLLLAAGLIAGGVALWETRKPDPAATPVAVTASPQIFGFPENDLAKLSLQANQQKPVTLERINGTWQITAPEKAVAHAPTIAFLTDLITNAKRDRTFTVAANRRAEFGLDQPFGTLAITLVNQQQHQLIIGKPTPDRIALYAQQIAIANPPPQNAPELQLVLIPIQFANALDRPVAEWKDKAKPASPQPSSNPPKN